MWSCGRMIRRIGAQPRRPAPPLVRRACVLGMSSRSYGPNCYLHTSCGSCMVGFALRGFVISHTVALGSEDTRHVSTISAQQRSPLCLHPVAVRAGPGI